MQANILMVDDRTDNLLALRAILEPLDCRLFEAHSGNEALKHLLLHEFALILMDVQMPDMDGFETAALIKEREKTCHIPIIFVTAISKEQHYVFKGYETGAVDYISKPFDADILRSKVRVFVDLWEKTEQIKRHAELMHRHEQREKEHELAALERDLEHRHLIELAESEARLSRFKSTLDATLDSVLMFDPETLLYTYANQGALRHLGYSCDELMAMSAASIKPQLTEKEFREMLEPLRAGEKSTLTIETLHRRKNGSLVPVEVFLQYITPEDGDPLVLSIVRDISERKHAEELLIAAKESAERANRAKSDFIAGVSHELRTPLNAILGFSKLLLNPRVGPLNEDQMAYTQDVVQGAEHLLQLINDILDLSKIEAGKMTLEWGEFKLAEILDQSQAIVREKAQSQGLHFSVEVSPEAAALPPIAGDERKIKQVMFNLLSNAVKFTPEGGSILISAHCDSAPHETQPAEAGTTYLVVSVRDTGIGIAPEHQARIFKAFEQVDSSYTRRQQGTGLGLALTNRIVGLHGGALWLESVEGQGSTFSFNLPLRHGPVPAAASKGEDSDIEPFLAKATEDAQTEAKPPVVRRKSGKAIPTERTIGRRVRERLPS